MISWPCCFEFMVRQKNILWEDGRTKYLHILIEFVKVSIAVMRHHYHGNSYKGRHLIGVAHF